MKTTFRQLVELVTDLKHRSERNLSFMTHIKIITILLAYIVLTIGSFMLLIQYVKDSYVKAVENSYLYITSGDITNTNLLSALDSDVTSILYATIAIVTLLTVGVGVVLTRLALSPLNEAFSMQKSFISGIAHEIRTPLSILRMNNEIAKFDLEESNPMSELLDENISDIDKINEILNNLLLFDRMGSLELLQMIEKNDLMSIARDVATQFRDLAAQKKISIFITGNDVPPVIGNKTAIEQVFFNLVKNAMLYTQSGGRINITSTGVTDEYVSIKISDTGVGIPRKDLPRIFEPFYRSEKTGKLSGTGIGLAIVYEIMKMHKGAIEVESIEGVGTSFLLTFPIRPISSMKRFLYNPVSKIFYDFSKRK